MRCYHWKQVRNPKYNCSNFTSSKKDDEPIIYGSHYKMNDKFENANYCYEDSHKDDQFSMDINI